MFDVITVVILSGMLSPLFPKLSIKFLTPW